MMGMTLTAAGRRWTTAAARIAAMLTGAALVLGLAGSAQAAVLYTASGVANYEAWGGQFYFETIELFEKPVKITIDTDVAVSASMVVEFGMNDAYYDIDTLAQIDAQGDCCIGDSADITNNAKHGSVIYQPPLTESGIEPYYGDAPGYFLRDVLHTRAYAGIAIIAFDIPRDQDVAWRITIEDVAAVPEPATWAVMILGFGVAGATLRRRRAFAL